MIRVEQADMRRTERGPVRARTPGGFGGRVAHDGDAGTYGGSESARAASRGGATGITTSSVVVT